MKLGILETDQPVPPLLEKYGSYSDMFQALFSSVDRQITFETYNVVQLEYPSDRDNCDAYLITGSKASPYEDLAWIKALSDYVVMLHRHQKKLIGICFGHQLIAQALGGLVQKSDLGWGVGKASRDIFRHKPWIEKGKKHFNILVSHQDQVTQIPPNAERIAGNDFCENASFQIGNHILTFQGHPEFQPGYLRQLIIVRREIIGADRANRAILSLQEETDHQQIARWMMAFLKG